MVLSETTCGADGRGLDQSSATELLLQNSVLLSEVIDYRIPLTGDPAGERCHKDLPGLEDGGHPSIVPTQHYSEQRSAGRQVE